MAPRSIARWAATIAAVALISMGFVLMIAEPVLDRGRRGPIAPKNRAADVSECKPHLEVAKPPQSPSPPSGMWPLRVTIRCVKGPERSWVRLDVTITASGSSRHVVYQESLQASDMESDLDGNLTLAKDYKLAAGEYSVEMVLRDRVTGERLQQEHTGGTVR